MYLCLNIHLTYEDDLQYAYKKNRFQKQKAARARFMRILMDVIA